MPRRPKDRSEYEGYDPVVTSPEPIERSEEEGYDPVVTMPRQDYKGFQMPSGMSLPQRRKWKRSIDVRESGAGKRQEARDDADTEALKQGIIDRTKDVGGAIKGAAEGVGDVIKAPFEYRAALATDPAGTMAATKEFGSRVMSGDPEARRQAAEGVSMSTVEPFATAADAELARQDLAKGDYAGAAISGASVLLPFVSAGWLKTAMRKGDVPSEAAEKVAELERRVDAGEVTDDMQIRREIAMIEDAHALDYAKSRPVEDPMQQGRSRPRADVDPEGAREFDREPPGYMGMSRPNQPMSRFSEGHERFIDELRTDMAEDTNFGELSGRFYNDLLAIDKREDMLRSVGKDARGRQLDDVQITNEYEKLSKERQALANEYYVGKAEREAALRHEGSYVPPGSKTSLAGEPVTPPGGGAGSFKRDQLARTERMGLAGGDPKLSSPKFGLKDQGHHNVVEDLGPLLPEDRDLLGRFAEDYNLSETELRQLRDEYVAYGYDDFPGRSARGFEEIDIPGDLPGGGGARSMMDLESDPKVAQKINYIIEMENSDAMHWLDDQYQAGKVSREEVLKELDVIAEQAQFDNYVDPDAYPNLARPQTMFDRAGRPMPELPPFEPATEVDRKVIQDTLRKYLRKEGGPGSGSNYRAGTGSKEADEFGYTSEHEKRYQQLLDMENAEYKRLEADGFTTWEIGGMQTLPEDMEIEFDELDELRDTLDPGRGSSRPSDTPPPTRPSYRPPGGRSEGPSEAEIQAMVDQRFGDPNELEMMKEDMRRMAELTQDEQIAQAKKNRARRSRTPGAPGATEGSVKRERPMPKAKKGKYEN